MKNLSFGKQIIISFGAIAFAFIISSYIVEHHTKKLQANIELVDELRLPTSQASKSLSNGISQSLAALRGWLILADPQFTIERNTAWQYHIEPALDQLTQLSANWTNAENIRRLDEIRLELKNFKESQEEITNIAHTIDATPATKLLLEQAKPLADNILTEITTLIEITSQKPFSKKDQELFKNMADFRSSFAQLLASIRLFLISADISTRLDFENNLSDNEKSYTHLISKQKLMTPEQILLFKELKKNRNLFLKHSSNIFSIRTSEQHNIATYLLKTKAAPSAKHILSTLGSMISNQKLLLNNEIHQLQSELDHLNNQINFSIILGLILTITLGYFIIKSFKNMQYDIEMKTNDLKDNAEINKGILDTSQDAIISINTSGIILSSNKTIEIMLGFTENEIFGKNINSLFYKNNNNENDISKHLLTGEFNDNWRDDKELFATKKDKTTLPISLSVGSISTGNENILTVFIRNITDQKTDQDKLESLRAPLRIRFSAPDSLILFIFKWENETDYYYVK